ncbi:ABC transporter permease [Ideonella sp. TBM-1]|uniref:ABC transporter permease n=2 Tax=Ideonella livida TaxID=2707176 RepID=A0A7C9PFL9_9BURK|nr:ABC transporter permease [Ideonella livida]
MSVWRLAGQQALRDFRAGELRLLWVAVLLAVAALTSVGFFADRLQSGLQRDAAQLLGGDVVVNSDHPVPEEYLAQARQSGLTVSVSAVFPSMARAPDAQGGATRLVAVKAVDDAYPLRGRLTVSASAQGLQEAVGQGPQPGTVFVDAGLPELLGLQAGDMLELGEARLRIARLLHLEPDRGAGFLSFAPRVMLHARDLPATGLVQPASRVTWRLAVSGRADQAQAVSRYAAWARGRLEATGERGIRLETLSQGRPEMRQTLERADKFLHLVALLAALLAAVAVAIAARDFAQRHLDDAALLRVLGLPRRRIAAALALEFVGMGLLAGGVGVAVGLGLHGLFLRLLADFVPPDLPPPGWWPALFGLGVGQVLLLGFGLPTVFQMAQVPPLRVLRRDLGAVRPASAGVLLTGALAFGLLLLAASRDLVLGAVAVGGFALAVLLFAVLAWVGVKALRASLSEARQPAWWTLAVRQLTARPAYAVLQVASLAVGLMALALLVLLRTDLINSWRQATPQDAPNRFVINIQPDQAEAFRQRLDGAGVQGYDWYPMFRGRLLTLNGVPVDQALAGRPEARRSAERELNLSHSAVVPGHNPVVAGQWQAEEPDAFSVEAGFAERLGLKLGDQMVFEVAGQPLAGRITSLRKVEWGSLRANFFVMVPRARLDDLPVTYMTAFRAPERAGWDNQLLRDYPNVTNVDVSASLAQVQRVLDQVVRAVEYLFYFTVAAGAVVLFASVSATREARAHEYAVMRACGASSQLLGRVQRVELLLVGGLAGGLATACALVVGWALTRWVFEFPWTAPLWAVAVGVVAGAFLAWAAGWWSLREVLGRPVISTLRRAAE